MENQPGSRDAVRRERRKFVLIAAVVSALMGGICLPFVKSMMLEDWMHHAIVRGALGPDQGVAATSPWDFFVFMNEGAPLEEKARAFWFAHPSLGVAFFRPLSSLLIAVDHFVFGASPVAIFIHSLAWYVSFCVLVAVLFSRVLPGTRGKVATVLFALLGTHHEVVVWSAARNSLLCGVFGVLALLAHLRFREADWKWGRWLTPLSFAFAYASGEAALSVFGFLLAYEALHRGDWRERLMALLPTLAVTVVWLGVYVVLGYGASHSGEYISPIAQPLRYLMALPQRLGFTMSVLLLGTPALSWVLAPALRAAFAVAGTLAVLGLVFPLRGSFRKRPDSEGKALSWLLLGMVFAVLPQLAGSLGPRSYLIPSIGAVALLAHVAVSAWESKSVLGKAGAGVLLLLHGALGVLMWPSMSMVYGKLVDLQQENFEALGLSQPSAAERSLLLITADPLTGYFAPMQFAAQTGKPLEYFRLLSVAESDHRLVRTGARAFELAVIEGSFMKTPTERMTRAPEDRFAKGDVVDLDDLKVEITSLSPDGYPNMVRFHLKGSGPLPEIWASDGGKMVQLAELPVGQPRVLEFVPPL